ncbi:MAG: Regulator of RpoS [Chlamydiia bacterium]|nr:Regulator of RpoS [Chlamydiia bacterium]MCH9615710.1 Regulator of RpoS [Chlamydiia bacterium]MCH9628887.1 Regulator of RpoS [Chlamydiia bacterium]
MKTPIPLVLIVDDDDDCILFTKLLLTKNDLASEIIVASDGVEGIRLFENLSFKPNLIILDLNMPRMNGWEFIDTYNQLPFEQLQATIICIASATTDPADISKAEELGLHLITKPLKAEYLKEVIGNI